MTGLSSRGFPFGLSEGIRDLAEREGRSPQAGAEVGPAGVLPRAAGQGHRQQEADGGREERHQSPVDQLHGLGSRQLSTRA